jgi:hypothetical protein
MCSNFCSIKNFRTLPPKYIYAAINTVSSSNHPVTIGIFNGYSLSSVKQQMEFYVQFWLPVDFAGLMFILHRC